jgi:hypothetical protein
MGETIAQIDYVAQEHRDNARLKRRQAEILCAEAAVLESCAAAVERAIEIDKKRNALSAEAAP